MVEKLGIDDLSERAERGAVLALMAVFLLIFLISAAIAVDLSALDRRGQTLQNTADAAALAGVATWQESGGDIALTEARVSDMLRQNGVTGTDVFVQVVPNGPSEIQVAITDTDPDVFLGRVGPLNLAGDLVRDASARLEDCDASCETEVELTAPFPDTEVEGSGDGYYPVAVGNRLYAINHDGDEIACIDRSDRDNPQCWSNRFAFPTSAGGPNTDTVAHTVVVGTRVFWTAQTDTDLQLYCWQTLTESPCSPTIIRTAPRGSIGGKYDQRGGGTIAVGSRIFVFTDDHRVHCVDSVTMNRCAGYGGGKTTGLGGLGFAPLDPDLGVTGSQIDRVLNETTGQIFHTLHIRDTAESSAVWTPGVWLDCWDTTTDLPCLNFNPARMHSVVQRQSGRLFLHRTSLGLPDGVCSTGLGEIECVDLFGTPSSALEIQLDDLEDRQYPSSSYTNGMGVHYYHEPTNRLLMSSPRQTSTIHCWDFDTSSYCAPAGGLYGYSLVAATETMDYGFLADGNCAYALGHKSVFWSFTVPDDGLIEPGCPGTVVTEPIDSCPCAGARRWGEIGFNFDIGEDSPFITLQVSILAPKADDPTQADHDNVLFPADGSGAIEMVGRESQTLILPEDIVSPVDYPRVFVKAYIETVEGEDPFDNPDDPPAILIEFDERPYLVE